MRKRINSETGKTVNLIDFACQNATKIVDELSINTSIKNSMWNNISKKLSSINKKVLGWFLITTTSVSVLLASTVLINRNIHDGIQNNRDTKNVLVATIEPIKTETYLNGTKPKPLLIDVQYKQLASEIGPIESTEKMGIPKKSQHEISIHEIDPINYAISSPIKTPLSVRRHINTYLPEIGLDYQVYQRNKRNKIFTLYLGLSAVLNRSNSSTYYPEATDVDYPTTIASQHYFSNVSFKLENTSKENTWNGKISYLLNDEKNTLFKLNTFRLSLQKSINKHIKIGPELILTNNFKSYYSGFGITVES